MAGPETLAIAHVTPHPWGSRHEVNEFAKHSAEELAERGHRVLICAPSDSRTAIRDSRAAIRAAEDQPTSLFEGDVPRVLAVGGAIPLPRSGRRPRSAPVPLDVGRTLETLFRTVPLDIVHVHDPFAPSVASTALRHSRSLNVGSFHEPTERVVSTQVTRPLVEIFFGRLDARTVSSRTMAQLMDRYFPGGYELVRPGVGSAGGGDAASITSDERVRVTLLFCAGEERGALRLFLRALRRLPLDRDWEAVLWMGAEAEPLPRVNRRLQERLRVTGQGAEPPQELIATADLLCLASGGPRPAPGLIRAALGAGAVPVASDLPLYRELAADGEVGLLFPPGDAETLAGQLLRLIDDPVLLANLRDRASGSVDARAWSVVADDLERIYHRAAARRHSPDAKPEVRRRLAKRKSIYCDLHMHTDHSPDCATPVGVLLETAQARGLGAIAITDHNEISGALEAREMATGMNGIKVIVAEEVKTADEGEVIGLFLERKIARGMSMAETIAEIRRQGGLVYVPHPFDRLHSVPDYEHLLKIVEEIDILEVFNPRIAFSAFNEEAERFAAKYRIVPGAGSDSHVAQGLGSVRIRLHDFDGPEEFLEAMRDADIVRKHRNLVYVQALKLLQTAGRPRQARRSLAPGQAKPVRGGRPRGRTRVGARRTSRRGKS